MGAQVAIQGLNRFNCGRDGHFAETPPKMPPKDAIDETKVIVSDACCCMYEGFSCEDCPVGCACNEVMCCCVCEFCCKNLAEGEPTPTCYCCAIRCESPTTCIKSRRKCAVA